jgi:Nif-specific regulatory protein
VGRAPTNQIVIKEEQASRQHAEFFLTEGQWVVRDLDSRNGTAVGNERVRGDYVLKPGDVVRIARTQLAFVHDLSEGYESISPRGGEGGQDTIVGLELGDDESGSLSFIDESEPTITHRRVKTRFLDQTDDDERLIPAAGRAATQLVRLAYELANETSPEKLAHAALSGLFSGTHADAGAILIAAKSSRKPKSLAELQIVASRSNDRPRYLSVSKFIAETVLREGEAVLARNIEGDSTLGVRDSEGVIHSTSVICAPIRVDQNCIGLVHLYSTSEDQALSPDDLEFTLAVAENVALGMRAFMRQQKLDEDIQNKRSEINQLRAQLGVESEIVGSSPEILKVHQEIARAAPSKATVLVRGESGVGKELVARAVHFSSPRKSGPFVCLNCAALSESLLESELFGHERGAFTGATDRKIGKFEAAHQGTLMLDEIGEMSQSIQAKFLRVLEGHPFERVGGSKAIKVDVRVIAATNRDLVKAVAEKKFRRDLYFRLHVVEIYVPPLRKRPSDIVEVAEYFLARFNAETGRKIVTFSPEAVRLLREYHWPGNVRDLKNAVERGVLYAKGSLIEPEDLALSAIASASESQMEINPANRGFREMSLEQLETEHIIATLKHTDWNKSRAAQILGVERSTLDRKIKRYQIKKR